MKRKHLVVLISVLLIIGVTITTLFATGVLHLKVFNDISSNADTDNENEIQDDLQEEGNQHSLEQQVSVLNETAGGNAETVPMIRKFQKFRKTIKYLKTELKF